MKDKKPEVRRTFAFTCEPSIVQKTKKRVGRRKFSEHVRGLLVADLSK